MPASTDDMLHALADGTRRDILRLVWTHERASGEIAARFAVTRQAVSQHLGVLLCCGSSSCGRREPGGCTGPTAGRSSNSVPSSTCSGMTASTG